MEAPGFISRRCADHFQPQVLTKVEGKVRCHAIDTNITDAFVANLCLQLSGSVDGGLETNQAWVLKKSIFLKTAKN
jgi:hypothetical protein